MELIFARETSADLTTDTRDEVHVEAAIAATWRADAHQAQFGIGDGIINVTRCADATRVDAGSNQIRQICLDHRRLSQVDGRDLLFDRVDTDHTMSQLG